MSAKLYFEMLACSCKGRRFQNHCINCGTKCFLVFTVELILLFPFPHTPTCFQKFVRLLCKQLFLFCKLFLFSAFFKIKCCLFRLITALSCFFSFFLLTQPCFLPAFKNLSGYFAKKLFLDCKPFLFSAFFKIKCCPFPIIMAGICFFLLTTPFVKLLNRL